MFAQTQDTLKDLNSEIKKETYNLSPHDKKMITTLNNNMKALHDQQDQIKKQQKKWIDDTNISINHKVTMNDKEFSKGISKAIINKVAPNITDNFNNETTKIKNNINSVEQTLNKFNEDIKKYKTIAVTTLIIFFVLATLILLITAMTNGVFDFLGVNTLYSVISEKLKKAEGFMTAVWFIMYFVPVLIWGAIVVGLGGLMRKYLL